MHGLVLCHKPGGARELASAGMHTVARFGKSLQAAGFDRS